MQNISCPGCQKHFLLFSAFVRHIEFHECPVISHADAAARCQKELEFARALESIDRVGKGVNRQKDFSLDLGLQLDQPAGHLPARPAIDNRPSGPWPSDKVEVQLQDPQGSAFPMLPLAQYRHGDSHGPDLLTGDENNPLHGREDENAWGSNNRLFPDAPPVQRPTDQQMQVLLLNEERERETRENRAMVRARGVLTSDPQDPKGPDFHPSNLFNKWTKLYKCPNESCKSK